MAPNKQSATLCMLKPEWWGSPVIQKVVYQKKKCDKSNGK
jgi:hypothetical protein